MSQNDGTHKDDLEKSGEALIIEEDLQDLFDYNIKTEKTTTKLLNDLVHAEEVVGQQILDLEQLRSQMAQEIESLKQEVQRRRSESQILSSKLKYPSSTMFPLRPEPEPTLIIIIARPSTCTRQSFGSPTLHIILWALYVTQLYFKVTKVKLEVYTEPHILRGGNPDTFTVEDDDNITVSCSKLDDLWSLVNTEW
uniref:Uncharacterized protein n=1 Tax=Sinocyclocheilus rhinocerous TaxID=307959 RepID=A0A673FKG7_9TELE